MKQLIKNIKILLGWPISLLAFYFIFRFALPNIQSVFLQASHINTTLLSYGIASFIVYFFLRGYLWQQILKGKKYELSLKECIFLWELAEVKRYVPGNIWSFLGKTVLFSEKKIPTKTIVSSLALEIQFLLFGSFVVSMLSIPMLIQKIPTFRDQIMYVLTLLFLVVPVFLLILYLFRKKITQRFVMPEHFPKTEEMIKLSVISILFMVFYGLGTYFTVSSLSLLSPLLIAQLIGLFVFAYLIGYLFFIVPMGLGVRESVITTGLIPLLPLSLAGFAALFARVVLIVSELLFLSLLFLWKTMKISLISKIENIIDNHKHVAIVIVLIFFYTTYFTTASFLRYDNFYTGRFDLGNMDQTVWNTFHGRIFQLTDPNGTSIISRLAFHADFILILLAPFYAVWSNPKTLLFIQTVVLGFGALFAYLLSARILKNKTLSVTFAFAYLLNPSVEHANLYDFHAVTLATTFLLAALFFLLVRRYIFFFLCLILAALTKENVWLISALLSFYCFFMGMRAVFKKHVQISKAIPVISIVFSVASFIILYFLVWYAIPKARGDQHFALSYYSDFGSSPTEIVKKIIFSPEKTLALLTQQDRLKYLGQLFSPLGFLSIFSPLGIFFALPDLVFMLLSNNSQLYQIYFHYASTITPFIFVSAIFGVKNMRKYIQRIPFSFFTYFIITTALITAYSYGPLPFAQNPNLDMMIKPQPYRNAIDDFLSRIPQKYSIAATNNLGSHLSHRQKIYTIPVGLDKADIVVFLLNDPFAQPSLLQQKQMTQRLKKDKNYITLFAIEDFVAFQKIDLKGASPD